MRRSLAAGHMARPAVTHLLLDALDHGALILVAPAGSGKTTALAEALEPWAGRAAWVHCSGADRDAGHLLTHVVEALRDTAPGVADAFADRLVEGSEQVDVGLATRQLVAELERLLVDPLAIVIDDAEQLEHSTEAASVVADLLAATSGRLRIAVAARRRLSLRTAKLRAAGRLTEFHAADLAFSVDECAHFARERRGRDPSTEEIEALWTATEGWPLGVTLAVSSEKEPLGTLAAGSGALSDYLVQELLEPLDLQLRNGLVDSSAAPEVDSPLATALGLGGDFVEEVRRRGVPLRAVHDGSDRIAYHPLVREFLMARFNQRPPERRREVHAAVAETLEASGRASEAVDHWLAAGVPQRAAAAVAVLSQSLVTTAPATVAGWLQRLPEELRADPALQFVEGRLATGAGKLVEAIAPLRHAMEAFEDRGDTEMAWLARVALADTLAIQEDFDAVIPLADGFESSGSPLAPMVALAAGAALAGVCRYRESEEMFEHAVAHPAGARLASLAAGFRGFWVDWPCGRPDAALAGARDAVAFLQRHDPVNRLPYVIGFAAVIEEDRGEYPEALATMAQAERLSQQNGSGGYLREAALRFRAGVHARAGRLAEAERELEAMGELAHGWFPGDADVTRATIAARRGEQAAASAAVERALRAGALRPWRSQWRTTALIAPVLVEAGRYTWARELVEDALGARPPMASCARLLSLRAWLRSLEGDEPGALADVHLAWEDADEGRQHLVRRERVRLEPLLWKAVEGGLVAPEAVVAAMEAAVPGGAALLPLTGHPLPAVRRAAAVAAAASGHPEGPVRLAALEHDPDASVAAAARASRVRLLREPPPLRFELLGGFTVRRGAFAIGDEAWGPRRRAAQRLVRFLLVQGEAAVHEDALFEAFWPNSATESARRSLQVTLSSARKVLDLPGAGRSVLEGADRTYRIALDDRDAVDADEFARGAAAALAADSHERLGLLEAAAARWTGEPLPEDRYEDWATAWRERLVDLYGRVLGGLADACSAVGDHPGAVEASRRAVELDPLDEGAHRRLMLAYARSGRRGHALRQYLACRRALLDGLGVEVSEESTSLQRRILAGQPL